MVYSCVDAGKVILRYLSLGSNRIRFISEIDSVQGVLAAAILIEVRDVYRLTADNATETITWDWFPTVDDRVWEIKGYWTNASIPAQTYNFTLHFLKEYGDFSLIVEEGEIIQWELKNHSYAGLEDPYHVTFRWAYFQNLIKVSSPVASGGSNQVLNIQITSTELLRQPPEVLWGVNFYKNGDFLTTKYTKGFDSNPPLENLELLGDLGQEIKEQSFLKEAINQAVELLPVPGIQNHWQLWLVFLDANQQEISREIINYFSGENPELLCIAQEGECPENSCKVDCNTHYCCYDNQGHSIYSFLK